MRKRGSGEGASTRRELLHSAAVAGLGSYLLPFASCAPEGRLGLPRSGAAPRKRPNVLLLIADQFRAASLGCLGNPEVRTPNLDRMAASGALFENAFALSPVCSPCRAQILSGKYGDRPGHRKQFPDSPFLYKLPIAETSIAEHLAAAGYATGYIGKWHVSARSQKAGGKPSYIPPGGGRQGFEHWIIRRAVGGHFDIPYLFGDDPEPVIAPGFSSDRETDWALDYIDEARDRPFFLTVSWNPPHDPYEPPASFDIYEPRELSLRPNVPPGDSAAARAALAGYYGLISAVDHNVGRLLDRLDERGIAEQTVVVFVSDHGDSLYSQRGMTRKMFHKRTPWSESVRVPLLVRQPGAVAADVVSDALVGSIDVLPTILDLAGLPIPADIQGESLAPALRGEPFTERESIFLHMTSIAGLPFGVPWRAVRTKSEWLAISGGHRSDGWLLYDLADDPYEQRNLVAEPAAVGRRAELLECLGLWRERLGDRLDLARFAPRE